MILRGTSRRRSTKDKERMKGMMGMKVMKKAMIIWYIGMMV